MTLQEMWDSLSPDDIQFAIAEADTEKLSELCKRLQEGDDAVGPFLAGIVTDYFNYTLKCMTEG